jgi:DNA-binding beta-propeller fold protein YncE
MPRQHNTLRLPGSFILGLWAALCAASAAAGPAGPVHYAITQQWQLAGAGGWDDLSFDAPRNRLFLTRSDRVEVIDADTGAPLGQIGNTPGVHAVVLAAELNRGYTSNGRGNSITEFAYDTLATLREVPVPGQNPDAMLYDVGHHHLYTFNGRSKDATVFDVPTLAVVAKLPLPDAPETGVSDGGQRIYVNIESDPGQLVVLDSARLTRVATWPLPGCSEPTGLAIDTVRHRLFSTCANQLMVVTDSTTGRQVARLPIGAHPDGAAFDSRRRLAFSSNGVGTLTVVAESSAGQYAVATTLQTQPGARTMTNDPASGRVFLVTSKFGPAPPATAERPHPRPQPLPDTFTVLVAAPQPSHSQRTRPGYRE